MAKRRTDDVALSDKLAKAATSEGKSQRILYDGGKRAVRGFGLRVTAGGAKSFILSYRNSEGRDRRYTIGAYPQPYSVELARKKASQLKREIDNGQDPLERRTEARTAPTMADLCDRYIEDYLPGKRPSSQAEDLSMIARIVRPKLGARKVAAVTHAEVDKLHRDLRGTLYRANRTLSLLSVMFSLAIKWSWVTVNPTKGVKRYTEAKRTRYLTTDELKRLTAALDTFPNQQVANIVRLLLLTGARRGEVLSATWDHLDLEAGVWSKPASLTKQNAPHVTPLGEAAIALLKRIRQDAPEDERVFSIAGKPMRDIKRQWEALREAAELPGVRLHDLRHTYASMLASGGASLPMIGALLGHASPVTTARYAHLFQDPLRKLADEVGHIVTGTKPAEVTPIRKGA